MVSGGKWNNFSLAGNTNHSCRREASDLGADMKIGVQMQQREP